MCGQLRMSCGLAMLVVAGTLLGTTGPAAAVEVNFPDANLEAKVRNHLSIPPPTAITDTDMETMWTFGASSSNIADIQGMEYGTNLAGLYLDDNQISDISAVDGLTNLTWLNLGDNQISDITAVAGLTNLTWLPMSDNQISDITAVAGLTNLTWLDLGVNQISDISAVAGLTNLDYLWLHYNQISDITAVAGLANLNYLDLYNNQISDISAVAGLTSLNHLFLYNNQISNISAVAGLTSLNHLYLYNNQISDISAVAGLTNLDSLSLGNNQISDISAVAGLTSLRSLRLGDNQIEIVDLSSAELSSLEYFDIASNPLTSVLLVNATLSQTTFDALMDGGWSYYTGIAELSGVLALDMSGVDFAGISDMSKMYTMDDLETLSLAGATNLAGSEVLSMTDALDSLVWLDVTDLWNSFNAGTQSTLNTWDAVEGNTLVIPEPATLSMLLALGLALLWWRRRRAR